MSQTILVAPTTYPLLDILLRDSLDYRLIKG